MKLISHPSQHGSALYFMSTQAVSVWPNLDFISANFGVEYTKEVVRATLLFIQNSNEAYARSLEYLNLQNVQFPSGQFVAGQQVSYPQSGDISFSCDDGNRMDSSACTGVDIVQAPLETESAAVLVSSPRAEARRRNRRKKKHVEQQQERLRQQQKLAKEKRKALKLEVEALKLQNGVIAERTKLQLSPLVASVKEANLKKKKLKLDCALSEAKVEVVVSTPVVEKPVLPLVPASSRVTDTYSDRMAATNKFTELVMRTAEFYPSKDVAQKLPVKNAVTVTNKPEVTKQLKSMSDYRAILSKYQARQDCIRKSTKYFQRALATEE